MLIVSVFATNLVVFYVAAALVGLGLSTLLGAPLRYIMLGEAGTSERAAAQGALALFTSTGQLVGAAIVGAVIASRGGGVPGFESAYFMVGAIAAALAVLAVALKGRAAELATVQRNHVVTASSTAHQAG